MRLEHVGKYARRAALFAATAFFSTCAPSSISAPPMRQVPDGPAMADREVSMATPVRTRGAEIAHTLQASAVQTAL